MDRILHIKEGIEIALLTIISIPTILWLQQAIDAIPVLVSILVGLSLVGLNILKGIEIYKRFKNGDKNNANKE